MGATNGIEYLILFAVALTCAAAATFAVRAFALTFSMVNHPNKIVATHIKPVAYLGGAAIFIAMIIAPVIINKLYPQALAIPESFPLNATITGAAGFLIFGILDDLFTFRPLIKLISQTLLAAASVALGIRMHITGIDLADSILSIAYIIAIVNATNVTDVCDGLVAGLCAIIFLLIAVFVPAFAPAALLMSACIFGFLFFNFPPATIYLGDAGAHFLGFVLAVVCIQGADLSELKLQAAGWLLLVPGVVLFEMIFLIVVRTRKGLPWYRGSPDHFSLRLQAAGFSRRQTDFIAWATNAAMVSAVCNLPYCPGYMQILIVLLVVAAFIVSWQFLLRHEVKKTS
jgi:UDP-GlcNAc:undecaprenyl-phosphate/decaprenyl-phosphate GlcNAc-1-phosphate transferase